MDSQYRIKSQPLTRASDSMCSGPWSPLKPISYHTLGTRRPPALLTLSLLTWGLCHCCSLYQGCFSLPSSPWVGGGAPSRQSSAQTLPSQKPFPPTISLLPAFLKFLKSYRYNLGNFSKLLFGTKERFPPAVLLWLLIFLLGTSGQLFSVLAECENPCRKKL